MVQRIVLPSNVPINDLAMTGNITCSNTFTTTNIFTTNLFATGNIFIQGGQLGTTLSVTGNAYVSNAITTSKLFANNVVIPGFIVSGNIHASNAISTGNLFGSGHMTLAGVQVDSFQMSITGNAYVSNAITTTTVFSNVVRVSSFITGSSIVVVGNLTASNTLTTTNIYVSNILASGNLIVTGSCTVTGNAYVANAVTTTNVWVTDSVYASNVFSSENVYSANSITTANVWTTNVNATGSLTIAQTSVITGNIFSANVFTNNLFSNIVSSGILRVTGDNTVGYTTLRASNMSSSNALTTQNVFTSNITSLGVGTFSSIDVTGNAYVSNALTTTNVFSNAVVYGYVTCTGGAPGLPTTGQTTLASANLTLTDTLVVSNIYSTGSLGLGSVRYFNVIPLEYITAMAAANNVFVSNTLTVQNAWFSSNVYCQKTIQVNTLRIYQDTTSGGLFTQSLTRRTKLPLYTETSSAPTGIFNGDEYYNTSTLALNKYIGGTWRTIGYPVLTTPVITQVSTQTMVPDSTVTTGIFIAAAVVIPVVQTASSASVGQITWSISGQPSNVYLTNQQSTGCSIVVPAGMYPVTGTFNVIVTAQNRSASATMTFSIVIPIGSVFAFTSFTFLSVVGTESTNGPTLAQCQSAYSGTPWITSYFSIGTYQGYQRWTVPASGSYFITTGGAAGGAGGPSPYGSQAGGAVIGGLFTLAVNDVLEMVIGSQGGSGSYDPNNANERGGGGGSFVRNVTTGALLLVAGGGGAMPSGTHGTACTRNYSTGQGQTGAVCGGMEPWCYTSVGPPALGYGGNNAGSNTGGSGGGYLSSGQNGGGHCSTAPGGGGYNNGMVGGAPGGCYGGLVNQGGFGGGGRGALGTPGGAGGYTGGTVTGAWSSYSTWGGGGGSYNVGTMKTGVQGGNGSSKGGYNYSGYVTITRFPTTPVSYSTSTILTTGTLQSAASSLFTPTALLFRMSTGGTSSTAFHKACDGFAPIFFVIRATNGYIATAYTNVPFTSKFVENSVTAAPGSNWLNNLWNGSSTSLTKYYNTNGPNSSLYDTEGYGPTFGGGHDLHIQGTMTGSGAYSNPSSYTIPSSSTLFGSYNFTPSEIEVYFSSTPVSYTSSTILTTGTLQSAALALFTPSRLLFRASRDGFSSSNFHTYCNKHAPIFIVIGATTGYIATAYTEVAFNNNNTTMSVPTYTNWLNNLWNGSSTSATKYYNTSTYGLYDTNSYGPTFGGGHDLYFPNTMNSGGAYSNPSSYQIPSQTTLFGSYNFTPTDIEVYF